MSKKRAAAPLLSEPAVRELLAVMAANNAPGKEDFLAVLEQVAGLEKQLGAAVEELAAMRKELAEAREGPVKKALGNAVKALEKSVSTLREKLGQLKTAVIDGCKKTLTAFQEQGVSALAHTAEFLHIRPALEAVGRELDQSIAEDEKALSVITNASREYHEAGLHLKNALRAVTGREPIAEPKGPGALARGLSAPLKAERAVLRSMKGRTEGALKRLEHLEQAARPPIRQTMEEMGAKAAAAQEVRERYAVPVKPKER